MLEQLKSVAANEGKERDARLEEERRKELDSWRERRREQLERLIEVSQRACSSLSYDPGPSPELLRRRIHSLRRL